MRAWPAPELPALRVAGPAVRVHDTASGGLAVYSASRTDDCPLEKTCSVPAPGAGQREQQP